jgi:ribosomal-protein-alanine N-acetyltransferase
MQQSINCPIKFNYIWVCLSITQTERITIREYLPEELETFLNHLFDERVALYIPKRNRQERIAIFNNALNNYKTIKAHGIWGMFDKVSGEFIGGCLLRPYDDEFDTLEIGYSIVPKLWGQGLATEMIAGLVKYGFTENHIKQIVAVTELPNIASQRVLAKNGFVRGDNVMDDIELAFFRLPR